MRDDANRWPTVTRERPCPRCGKPDRCTLAFDGRAGRCWRDGGGTTWHDGARANDTTARTRQKPEPTASRSRTPRTHPTLADAVGAARLTIRGGATLHGEPWLYRDAAGGPLMAVARFDLPDGSKQCRPFKPSGNGWSIGDPPGPLPLYRLDALAAAGPSARVYVCEGEKCADALASIGLLATTSSHGAAAAGKADWSPLAGRADVVVLPDRDSPGERYRAEVNSLLFRLSPPPASVRVVRLEHPRDEPTPDGFDVADWIDARDGDEPLALASALESLVDAAKPESPDAVPAEGADADETPLADAAARLRRREPWRPMPLDAFPLILRDFISASADVKDVDPALVALPVLAVASASVGNARRLRLRRDYCPPAVVWPVAVAESGDGKSPGFDAAMRPLVSAQGELKKAYDSAMAEHREAVRAAKAAKTEAPDPPSPMQHLYVSDATAEAVAARLGDSPRGLLLAVDEFRGIVASFNAHKGGRGSDREAYLAFYDARAAKIDRKTSVPPTIFIPRAFVSLTGTIQPSTLRDVLTPDMVGCGFAARLLLAMPPTKERAWRDDDVPVRVADAYVDLIGGLRLMSCAEGDVDEADDVALIRPTEAAMNQWRNWWVECERARAASADAAIRALYPKVRDAAARLALVFHCCHVVAGAAGVSADRLDASSMDTGIRLARWFLDEGRRVYAMLAGDVHDDTASRLVAWIGRRPGRSATARDVARHLREYPRPEAARAALDALARAGVGVWRELSPGVDGGRPSRTFVLADETSDCDGGVNVSSASATVGIADNGADAK